MPEMNGFLLMSRARIILTTFYLLLTTLCGFHVIAKWSFKNSCHLNHSFKSRAFESGTLCHSFSICWFQRKCCILLSVFSLHIDTQNWMISTIFIFNTSLSDLLLMMALQLSWETSLYISPQNFTTVEVISTLKHSSQLLNLPYAWGRLWKFSEC